MKRKKVIISIMFAMSVAFIAAGITCYSVLLPKTESEISRTDSEYSSLSDFYSEMQDNLFENKEAENLFISDKPVHPNYSFATYTSPEGIVFESSSTEWDEQKLRELYEELLKNKHGEELYTLSCVSVNAYSDEDAAASHGIGESFSQVSFKFPALPSNFNFQFNYTYGYINLYDGDNLTTISEMADCLSHEYGHHYTFYHMFDDSYDIDIASESEYAALRGDNFMISMTDYDEYVKNHFQNIYEVAAEDYVTLMGSPTTRSKDKYFDVKDTFENRDYGETETINRSCLVQENLLIPMASDVPGLADYFYSFVSDETPEFAPRKDLNITVEKKEKTFDFNTGNDYAAYGKVSWEKRYGDNAVYTLVCFDRENYENGVYPVKTINSDEAPVAYVGRYFNENDSYIYFCDDNQFHGTVTFAVSVMTEDGGLYLSELYDYDTGVE